MNEVTHSLKLMLRFFQAYPSLFAATQEIVQLPVAQMDSALVESNARIERWAGASASASAPRC